MKNHDAAIVEAMANAIVKNFIPKDEVERSFSFHFTIPPSSNYKVYYEKDAKGQWSFVKYEIDETK